MSERARIAAKTPEAKKENSASRVQKKGFSQSINPSADHILSLQRTIGNQAVQRLIKSGALQAKLRIGRPGDRYEQEADRVADRVMRMPEPQVQRQPEEAEEEPVQAKPLSDQITPLVQRQEEEEEPVQAKPLSDQITPLVQKQDEEEEEVQAKPLSDRDTSLPQRQADEEEEEEPVQAKPLSDQITPLVQRQEEEEEEAQAKELSGKSPSISPKTETSIRNIKGGGQPLPESTRAFMEPQFGRDFSNVRIHKDSQADGLAQSVNAKAFTLKNDIVFKSGQYSTETSEGKRLLAHELTHVVQQGNGRKVQPIQRDIIQLKVKSGPAKTTTGLWFHAKSFRLKKGEKVNFKGKKRKHRISAVNSEGKLGYISKNRRHFKKTKSAIHEIKRKGGLWFRRWKLLVLKKGEEVDVKGVKKGRWLWVEARGIKGYVYKGSNKKPYLISQDRNKSSKEPDLISFLTKYTTPPTLKSNYRKLYSYFSYLRSKIKSLLKKVPKNSLLDGRGRVWLSLSHGDFGYWRDEARANPKKEVTPRSFEYFERYHDKFKKIMKNFRTYKKNKEKEEKSEIGQKNVDEGGLSEECRKAVKKLNKMIRGWTLILLAGVGGGIVSGTSPFSILKKLLKIYIKKGLKISDVVLSYRILVAYRAVNFCSDHLRRVKKPHHTRAERKFWENLRDKYESIIEEGK